MGTLDVILSIIIFIFFLFGLKKGFIATIINLAAFVFFFVLIVYIGPVLKEIIQLKFTVSEFLATTLSYFVIFLVIFLISAILIKIFTKILKALKINWINRLLGGVLGVANALIIITVLFLIFMILPFPKNKKSVIEQSKILTWIDTITKDYNIPIKNLPQSNPIDDKIKELMKKKDEHI